MFYYIYREFAMFKKMLLAVLVAGSFAQVSFADAEEVVAAIEEEVAAAVVAVEEEAAAVEVAAE